ncbi:MAG: sugar phosphate isomerase/epimerase [Cyclobacteriaceae bacterium]|nr:sugar phosphate isomerase/epimerase [Cyclobacteriaceae bacterium]
MIKLSVAIAGENALPSAFVVFRGFEHSIQKASELGFDGIELALKSAGEIKGEQLSTWLSQYGLEVSCISTGQVYADGGLMFTDPDPHRREKVKGIFREIIDVAADFGQLVNIGRVRGQIGNASREQAENLFAEMVASLCEYANQKSVTIILEPVNRYEIDFINSVSEGVVLLQNLGIPNLKLMPDTFHMNIEDRSIGGELEKYISYIKYIHFADSNRMAPGQGHTDFTAIFDHLKKAHYQGWISLEILPKPDPDTAASQGISFLKPLVEQYNLQTQKS